MRSQIAGVHPMQYEPGDLHLQNHSFQAKEREAEVGPILTHLGYILLTHIHDLVWAPQMNPRHSIPGATRTLIRGTWDHRAMLLYSSISLRTETKGVTKPSQKLCTQICLVITTSFFKGLIS